MAVAPYKLPRRQNVPGNVYVDESCIDCDVCRWMCPSVFDRKGIKSAVTKQPDGNDEKMLTFAAMVACPVGSIRTRSNDPLMKQAAGIFPAEVQIRTQLRLYIYFFFINLRNVAMQIDPVRIPGVMHLGYHSSSSFGATPYFIRRPGGNIMIDTPRYNSNLARNIEEEGGLRYIILTHKHNVVDHEK